MTLGELIAKLIDLEVEHGDLQVVGTDDDMMEYPITGAGVVRQTGHMGDKVVLEMGAPE